MPGKILIPAAAEAASAVLPAILQPARRGEGAADPLLACVEVTASYDLARTARSAEAPAPAEETVDERLFALEAEDGTTIFLRADRLAEEIARLAPDAGAGGTFDLARLRDPRSASRGEDDWLWRSVKVLSLKADSLGEEARRLAIGWAQEKLGVKLEETAYDVASWLGAKALMHVIESRLADEPGLYRWDGSPLRPGERMRPGDPRLAEAARQGPLLIFIHGTGSTTLGGFGHLPAAGESWAALGGRYPGRVFAFEHRTFSRSPIENAVELADLLPDGAEVLLVTHSRGGLVGDLLALGGLTPEEIAGFRTRPDNGPRADDLAASAAEERAWLGRLAGRLGRYTVARYVRVAAPARGTRLLSDNLDVALSLLLKGLQGVAMLAGPGWERAAAVLKRLVLEIVRHRLDPRLVPGIEAMLVDAPLAVLLANARRDPRTAMLVIAGDTEFEGILGRRMHWRLVNLFADWALFDRTDNDLVVDTDSMFAGLAMGDGVRCLFDQGELVDHFSYFENASTRGALQSWLTADDPQRLPHFDALENRREAGVRERLRGRRAASRAAAEAGPRPVVILVPGIMGSHIELRAPTQPAGSGRRIWFDVARLAAGGLARIADPKAAGIQAEDLFEMFYGDLAETLAEGHLVRRFPYDWRRPVAAAAAELARLVEDSLAAHPGQPVRLLAHSLGGLVCRWLIHAHRPTWDRLVASGGRLVMLGTPNQGSHMMVHGLLGKSGSLRQLAVLSQTQELQEILDIVGGFPGAIELLPRPGFEDAGGEVAGRLPSERYYDPALWPDLRAHNRDRWFGDRIGAQPTAAQLRAAGDFWAALPADLPDPERIAYVFGQADETPCGVAEDGDRLRLLFTSDGDGSVTWASGRIDALMRNNRCWYMPVEHADLASSEAHFAAIVDLLESGRTERLERLPARRGEAEPVVSREAGPAPYPGEEELARSFLGSKPRRRTARRARRSLKVSVRAGDLRYTTLPVLCGHYIGDAISGAEAVLDEIVDGQLSLRHRLGAYADAVGTSVIVLMPRTAEEARRGSGRGAIVVGLGEMNGRLSSGEVTESVRAAVLRRLLRVRENPTEAGGELRLASLLIGHNSTAHISIGESLAAVVRGVCEANARFGSEDIQVTELEFVEIFRDSAISAAHAIHELPERLAGDLRRLDVRIEPAREMIVGQGARHRLSVGRGGGYWPRLAVSDAEHGESECPPECYRERRLSPIPDEVLAGLLRDHCPERAEAPPPPPPATHYPERLRYVFVSERARAESVAHQRQPGLIESIVKEQIRQSTNNPKLSRTLYELMVPLEYKPTARELHRLVLQVDGYTANLPWELLQADNEPMVLKTAMVRQFVTSRFRRNIRTAPGNTACIIVDPSTDGYAEHFGRPAGERLPALEGAVREGEAIRGKLRRGGYRDDDIVYSDSGAEALDVLARLYERPYRVLVVAAHGVHAARHRDGQLRSGVVLSGGTLITAAEIGQMEVVPELVFLNCCHLGRIDTGAAVNRLAYSVARELIEMGVRCVIAAGWAVNDAAACTFAETFFEEFLVAKASFGEAVHRARGETYRQHAGSNTWGAYQAYGDPGYRLDPADAAGGSRGDRMVAVDELLVALAARRHRERDRCDARSLAGELSPLLDRAPPAWLERPEVLQALAQVYAEAASDGFETARGHYLRAIALEDKEGLVAIRSIEQLANLEARTGERRGGEAGRALIEAAIGRLEALRAAANGPDAPANPERSALLGSAMKRLAVLLLRENTRWGEIRPVLRHAAAAYGVGAGTDPATVPYNTLNHLQLAWLADGADAAAAAAAIALARRCADAARSRFAGSQDFFDAVMPADAEVTAWLYGAPIDGDPAEHLLASYRAGIEGVPASSRAMDSVVAGLRLLAEFLAARRRKGDVERARVLRELASALARSEAA